MEVIYWIGDLDKVKVSGGIRLGNWVGELK